MEKAKLINVTQPVDVETVFNHSELEEYVQQARIQSMQRELRVREIVLSKFFSTLEFEKRHATPEENKVLAEVQDALMRLSSAMTSQVREKYFAVAPAAAAEPRDAPAPSAKRQRARLSAFEPIAPSAEQAAPEAQPRDDAASQPAAAKAAAPFNVSGIFDVFRRRVTIGRKQSEKVAI